MYQNLDVKSIERKKYKNYDYFIKWIITDLCNFNCYFCSRKCYIERPNFKDELEEQNNQMKKTVERLNNELKLRHNKGLYVELLGGEATLIDLPYLFSNLFTGNDNRITIRLITNGSAPDDYYLKIKDIALKNRINLLIKVSLHETETDADAMIEKVKRLAGCINSITIVIHDDNSVNIYKKMCVELEGYPISIASPHPIFDNIGYLDKGIDRVDECDEVYKEKNKNKKGSMFIVNGEEPISKYNLVTNYFNCDKHMGLQGYNCHSFIRLLHTGDAYHCPRPKTPLENILNDDPIVCPYEYCTPCYIAKVWQGEEKKDAE